MPRTDPASGGRKVAACRHPGPHRLLPAAAGAALLLIFAAWSDFAPHGVAASQVALRNGSLVVQNATCELAAPELLARDAVLLAVAANTTGKMLRSEYAQAYLCTDGLSLCDPLDVLQGAATIEANNSNIVTGSSVTYESLDLTLRQNNTLTAASGDVVGFYRSTVRFGSDNWMYVSNGTTLEFNSSQVIFSNYMAWSTEDSTVLSTNSVLNLSDIVLYGSNSRWGVVDSTWVIQSLDVTPPGAFAGQVGPLLWFENSDISIQGSLVTLRNYSGLLANTSLLLVNSTLELYGTTLELWASPVGLINSRIVLYDGSEIDFLCGSSTVFEGIVVSASLTTSENAAAAPQLGKPLGLYDALVVTDPYGTIELASEPAAPAMSGLSAAPGGGGGGGATP